MLSICTLSAVMLNAPMLGIFLLIPVLLDAFMLSVFILSVRYSIEKRI